jgi:hypothetical protein
MSQLSIGANPSPISRSSDHPALDRLVREADPALRARTARTCATIVDQSIAIATERIMATLGHTRRILRGAREVLVSE